MKLNKTLIISDTHLEQDVDKDKSYLTIKRMIPKEKFDVIVLNGDFLDLSYISQWTRDMPGLVEGKRLTWDLQILRKELTFFKKHATNVIYIEGNHEARLQNFLHKNPVLEGMIELDIICKELGVAYIPTVLQPLRMFSDLYIAHGLSLNKYCAANNAEKSGVSIITGHSHRSQMYTTSYMNEVPLTGYSIGCVSSLCPGWVKGKRITGWSQSFGILYGDKDQWDLNIIMLKDHKCIVGGKLYK